MTKDPFGFGILRPNLVRGSVKKKKKRTLTGNERIIAWENARKNKNGAVVCVICKQPIYSLRDAEPDHTRAFSKGGSKMGWAHGSCNRSKGSKSMSEFQKRIGVKTKKKIIVKRKTRKKVKKPQSIFDIASSYNKKGSGLF